MRFLQKILLLVVVLTCCNFVFAQGNPKVLVVYYSRDGHTKSVAESLAKRFNADIERLIDKKKRTGPIGFPRAGKDAIAGNLTELEALKFDPQDYQTILIGTPGWWGNVTPAVRTFVTENDLSNKAIGIFGTVHLTGIENALKQVAEIISPERPEEFPTLPLRHRDLKDEVLDSKINEFHKKIFER